MAISCAFSRTSRWRLPRRSGVALPPRNDTINEKTPLFRAVFFNATLVYKPGSVLTAIYLALQLLAGSSRLLEAVGSTCMLLHGVAPDRVYIVKPMSPWAGWALTPPFHPYLVGSRISTFTLLQAVKLTRYTEPPLSHQTRLRWALMGALFRGQAVYLCCTCPGVTPGGRYPLSLPCGARTFLTCSFSACSRGCPTRSRKYCNANAPECQTSCKFFPKRLYYR